MKTEIFLNELSEELELEDIELSIDTDLRNLDEWDSMAVMIVIGYASDNFNVNLTGEDLNDISTIKTLIELIGNEKFD